jgi:N-acetylglucosaminyl-diphospho-decaprenol L-rhamnosyltransferase
MNERTDGRPARSIGVLVVNYGAHRLLAANLGELDQAPDIAVAVVDNFHSTAERYAVIALAQERGWELLTPDRNLGFGDGNNLGAQRLIALGCETIVLLNPDAELAVESCRRLADLARMNPHSLVSPKILRPDGTVWFAGSQLDLGTGRVSSAPGTFISGPEKWLSGAVLAAHRDSWQELGGFAPGYFLYWEDVDISWRCVNGGGTLIMAPDITAVHDAHGTQLEQRGSGGKSPIYYFYNCRNRLLFAGRHLSTRQVLKWIWHTPAESKRILYRGGRRQLVTSPKVIGYAVAGAAAGSWIALKEILLRAIRRSPSTP